MNDLGLMVLGLAVRASVLAGFGLLVMLVLRRRGPSARALVSSTTLAALVGLTLLSISPWPRWWSADRDTAGDVVIKPSPAATAAPTAEILSTGPTAVPQPADGSTGVAFSDFVRELRRELSRPTDDPRSNRWRWPAWTALAFLVALSIAVLRLGVGLWAVQSLRSRSRSLGDTGLLAMVEALRGEMGLHQVVDLRESAEVSAPATIGWLRPVILLPEGWADWDEGERRAVLAHELAHILRRDYLTGLAAQVSLSLHAYHPLVHALARRLRLEQELAADAWGARLSGGRRAYLTALANLALRQAPRPEAWPSRPFLPTRGTFLRRIEMLRDPKALEHPPLTRPARAITVAGVVLATLIVAGLRGPTGSLRAQDPPASRQPQASAKSLPLIDPASASSDVHLAIDVRTAQLLQNPEFKKLVNQIPGDRPNEMSAILSGEIVQIVVLGFDRRAEYNHESSSLPPQVAFIFRSAKPMDWKTFISPKVEEVKSNGISYFRAGPVPGSTCYRVIDDQTLLMGNAADAINPPIGSDRPKGRHGWDDAWKQLTPGAIRFAFDTPWLARLIQPAGPQGRPAGFSAIMSLLGPLLEKSQAYAMTLDVPDGLTIDALATSASEENSQRVAETVRACLALARNAVPDLRRAAEGGHPELARTTSDLLDALDAMLETAKVTQEKTVTKLQAKADTAAVATAARLLLPAVTASREAARRSVCVNNLKQILLAMHNYHSTHDCFPPAVLYGPDGKTPYSWRVAILPFIEQVGLYNQYKFDEPWDGPNNKKLIALMPAIFACPDDEQALASHYSSYFAPIGPESLFPDRRDGMKLQEITDGTSNTIMVVEAKRPIPWTKPEDIPLVNGLPKQEIGQLHPGGLNVGFGDGAVRFVKNALNENVLRALFTRANGEVISSDSF